MFHTTNWAFPATLVSRKVEDWNGGGGIFARVCECVLMKCHTESNEMLHQGDMHIKLNLIRPMTPFYNNINYMETSSL